MARDDEARIRILEAYERARAYNPKITQGQFMLRGAPGQSIPKAPGKFKNEASAARYLRKIISGERTGGSMYTAGSSRRRGGRTGGLFQFRIHLGTDASGTDRAISQNIMAYDTGNSTFDLSRIEDELRGPRRAEVQALIDKYRSKYGMEHVAVDAERITARPVVHQRTMPRLTLFP
jgi:hypothetical protein